jgi:hypothetical protein
MSRAGKTVTSTRLCLTSSGLKKRVIQPSKDDPQALVSWVSSATVPVVMNSVSLLPYVLDSGAEQDYV